MKQLKIIVPATPLGLNQLNLHNKNWEWVQKQQLKRKWFYLILEAFNKPPNELPHFKKAKITLRIYWKDKRRIKDEDNLKGGFKPILDTIRQLCIITDDDPEHLEWGYIYQKIGKPERTEIILREL